MAGLYSGGVNNIKEEVIKESMQRGNDPQKMPILIPYFLGWVSRSPGFWAIYLMLLISGGFAIAQGGVWIALMIYVINITAVVWSQRK